MIRTLVRSALVAALVTAGSFVVPKVALADDGHVTHCNSRNPGRGCPRGITTPQPNNPVCARGRHVGNPHCVAPTPPKRPTPPKPKSNVRVRATATRTTPRVNKAVAPRRGTAVSTRAGKAL